MKLLRSHEAVARAVAGDLSWHEPVRCEYGEYTPIKLWFAQEVSRRLHNAFDMRSALAIDTSKKGMKQLVTRITVEMGGHTAGRLIDTLLELSTEVFTRSGASIGMDDLKEINAISHQARMDAYADYVRDRDSEKFSATLTGILKESEQPIMAHTELPIVDLVASGSRGNYTQLSQMVVCKGAIVNAAGKLEKYPVFHSFFEGINPYEMFSVTKASRPAVSQSKSEIGKSGYLTSLLVKATRNLIITEDDCGSQRGMLIPKKVAYGRYSPDGYQWTRDLLRGIDGDTVEVRSPITCASKTGCCAKCYGLTLDFDTPAKVGYPIGVASGQALGEPTTQLMLRTFHTSSVGSIETETFVAPFAGQVHIANADDGSFVMFEVQSPDQVLRYPIHESQMSDVLVADGDTVKVGQPIARFKRFVLGIGEQVGSIRSSFEMWTPKMAALLAGAPGIVDYAFHETDADGRYTPVRGVVVQIRDEDGNLLEQQATAANTEFLYPSGTRVAAGDKLTVGLYNFKSLYQKVSLRTFAETFVASLFEIYDSNGASINCRDVEVILTGMLSYRKVTAALPDADFQKDDLVSRFDLAALDEVEQVVLGISDCIKTSTNFVSAASAGWVKKALMRGLLQEISIIDKSAASCLASGHLIHAGLAINPQYLDDIHPVK